MKIEQVDYFTAMANIDSSYLYRVMLCNDAKPGCTDHISARIKLAKRCTIEELNMVKCDSDYAFVFFWPDDIAREVIQAV